MGAVFFELGGVKRGHVSIEAVPVPFDCMASLPMVFKTEFQQRSDELNDQFHAKHLIETGPGRGLHDCIPPGFHYFWVTFGLDKGYLHVIENDPGSFKGFGSSVLRSVLPPNTGQTTSVKTFAEKFAAYDWTKQLL